MHEDHEFRELLRMIDCTRMAVLTGAGCSTESGIPDYRGPETRRRARNPITFQQYLKSDETQRRYWVRSAVGWPMIRDAKPNAAHVALARLEAAGQITGLITQNVDRLHHAAGSSRVVELHGALAEVVCLDCRTLESRDAVQARILETNPGFDAEALDLAPDGDAEVDVDVSRFAVPTCLQCGGALKPHVVFFGENVPRDVLEDAWDVFEDADSLLVVGSSLMVSSGLRFVKRATERHIPVAIVNLGPTRGDDAAWIRVDGMAGTILPALAEALDG